jgi:hypothetical protein
LRLHGVFAVTERSAEKQQFTAVGFDEFSDGEAICGFCGRDGAAFADE